MTRSRKLVTVVGARPQFVKAAVVSRAMAAHERLEEVIVHTGQHFDGGMSDVFFEELAIDRPRYNLGVRETGHAAMTAAMLAALEPVLVAEAPDAVLVYGDTNSTLAGALAAAKLGTRVCHVEAGLRSFDRRMPEEVNRVVVDHLAHWLCSPTETAVRNLLDEGLPSKRTGGVVINTGDVMFDAVHYFASRASPTSATRAILEETSPFALVTVHRAENTDDPGRLRSILDALALIAEECRVVLPLHPRTRRELETSRIATGAIQLIPPVGYLDMLSLLRGCESVLTDSGGLQKEAYFLGRPCVTLRERTEWPETVASGANVLAGADGAAILAAWRSRRHLPPEAGGAFGDGCAGEKIAALLAGTI